MSIQRFFLMVACMLGTGGAFAAPDLEPQESHGIRYLHGGVGEGEATEMRSAARDYPLSLTFTGTRGEYLADVTVQIRKSSGEAVFDALAKGPMMLVQLPPGRYTLEASFQGRKQTRQIQLGPRTHRALQLRWPLDEAPLSDSPVAPNPGATPTPGASEGVERSTMGGS